MSETRDWLSERHRRLVVRHGIEAMLATVTTLFLGLGLGLWFGRLGLYRIIPEAAVLVWAITLAAAGGIIWWVARRRHLSVAGLATEIERHAGLRSGAVAGATGTTIGSAALAEFHDRRTAGWLAEHGEEALAAVWLRRRRSAQRAGTVAVVTGILFILAGPALPRAAEFWRPWTTINAARSPVLLQADRNEVRRGDSVSVRVTAAGRNNATLYRRSPGEPWQTHPVVLDSLGSAQVTFGPLEADHYFRAASGGRNSDTVHVRVTVPLFLQDVELEARYPAYQARRDEPLPLDVDTLYLPVGTRVMTRGRASVPPTSVSWIGNSLAVGLALDGVAFSGSLAVTGPGQWTLLVRSADGSVADPAPVINVVAVPDVRPEVSLPVPGADTTAPLTLKQPLVIDVRDDHRVTLVEVVTRRVTRFGHDRGAAVDTVPLPDGGVERAVLQWLLDLEELGYLPGDTAYVRARATDNAPVPQQALTREYALRLPTLSELRDAVRSEARNLTAQADSVAGAQRDLVRETEDLTAGRRNEVGGRQVERGGDPLEFRQAERAEEIVDRQERLTERARELAEQVRELSEAAWAAGLTDPEWHGQLDDLRRLLDRAITPELEETMRALRDAMRQLDAPGVRDALERLAEAQRQLRAELERSRELFERAALEGELTALAKEAEEVAAEQREWNRTVTQRIDTALAQRERELSARVDTLSDGLSELAGELERAGTPPGVANEAMEETRSAASHMRRAAEGAESGDRAQAEREGERASERLDPIAERLLEQRQILREEWRQDVLGELQRALVETAQLAGRQENLAGRLERGEGGPDVRAQQGAVRDGVDRVIERVQRAAGRHALVSPQLGAALGMSRQRMSDALSRLQQAQPNTRAAAADAAEALDALNLLAMVLLRSMQDVAGAESGSGLAEALERMAQLASQQNAIAGETGGMLPMIPGGGDMIMAELRSLAERQRRLARELERMRAEGGGDGTGELAREADELARRLEEGAVDRQTVERQERLYRRLLDQGRTLRGSEEDEREERRADAARPGEVHVPGAGRAERGPRYGYPGWEELMGLSPDDRRLILDYFRRLNDARP